MTLVDQRSSLPIQRLKGRMIKVSFQKGPLVGSLLGSGYVFFALFRQQFVRQLLFWYAFKVFRPQPRIPTNPSISPTFCWVWDAVLGCLNFLQLSAISCAVREAWGQHKSAFKEWELDFRI